MDRKQRLKQKSRDEYLSKYDYYNRSGLITAEISGQLDYYKQRREYHFEIGYEELTKEKPIKIEKKEVKVMPKKVKKLSQEEQIELAHRKQASKKMKIRAGIGKEDVIKQFEHKVGKNTFNEDEFEVLGYHPFEVYLRAEQLEVGEELEGAGKVINHTLKRTR